ncbi:MAG: hypothetical protein N2043_12520 [Ignavibacterium sp.]|nr:hypothetical protein [Ignavibacterium sp.]
MNKQFNLQSFFTNININEPLFLNDKIVFLPLSNKSQSEQINYISLGRAISENLAEVIEVNEHGSVPAIKVINKSSFFLLIPQGEQLVGAKQNRIVNTSILLEPESIKTIPVSCIEQGRWHYVRPNFVPSDEISTYKLRKATAKSVIANLKQEGSFKSNQYKIWEFIDSEFRKDNLYSDTSSYIDFMKMKFSHGDKRILEFDFPNDTCGFGLFFGRDLVAIEYFSNPNFFRENKNRILIAIIVEAKDFPNTIADKGIDYQSKLNYHLKELFDLEQIVHEGVGVGYDYKATDYERNIDLSFLVYNNQIVHFISLF